LDSLVSTCYDICNQDITVLTTYLHLKAVKILV